MPPSGARALLLNGTVGAGKTTVAEAVAQRLAARSLPGALVDLDGLRRVWPSPPDDPFQLALTLANLGSLARHALDAGARYLVLAGVVESRAERDRYAAAVGVPLTVVRLRATAAEVATRLRRRHADDVDGLAWHLARRGELDAVLDAAGADDAVLDTTGRGVADVTEQVLRRWALPPLPPG